MKFKLFYSYCQQNKNERKELEKYLNMLVQNEMIEGWYDGNILPGENWNAKIDINLEQADIVVFLVTAEWLASDPCKTEWETAKKWCKSQTNKVLIPIIATPCPWTDYSDMSLYQALPETANPVSLWSNKEQAWLNIYNGIKSVIESLKKKLG